MIVVDTNTIAYLYLPSSFTAAVEALRERDPEWIAPSLWRSEFRSVLSVQVRRRELDLSLALEIQATAEELMTDREYEIASPVVLNRAAESGCSAYDCEFVCLAEGLGTHLVTADGQLLRVFPETAIRARDLLTNSPGP